MNLTGNPPEPPHLDHFAENRYRFPLDELEKYVGQYVAFSPDGLRILASGESLDEVDQKLAEVGIHYSQVVHEYIEPA